MWKFHQDSVGTWGVPQGGPAAQTRRRTEWSEVQAGGWQSRHELGSRPICLVGGIDLGCSGLAAGRRRGVNNGPDAPAGEGSWPELGSRRPGLAEHQSGLRPAGPPI